MTSNSFWLKDERMALLRSVFPESHGSHGSMSILRTRKRKICEVRPAEVLREPDPKARNGGHANHA